MALTTSIITGRVPLPNSEPSNGAEVVFALNRFDTEGAEVVLPASVRAVLTDNGELPAGFDLWRNTEGLRGTYYIVVARWTERSRDRGRVQRESILGKIQVHDAATYELSDLLNQDVDPAPNTFWSAITQQQFDEVMAAEAATLANAQAAEDEADRAEAAAAQAVNNAPFLVKDAATFLGLSSVVTSARYATVDGMCVWDVLITGETGDITVAGKPVKVLPGASGKYCLDAIGALGNGITYDTAALALALSKSGRHWVGYPGKTYLTKSVAVEDVFNFAVSDTSFKIDTQEANGVFRVKNSALVAFLRCKVQGTGVAPTTINGYQHHGIYASDTDGIIVEECEIFDMTGGGVLTVGCSQVRVNRNHMHGNHAMSDIAIGYGSSEHVMLDCEAIGNRCLSENSFGVSAQGVGKGLRIGWNTCKHKAGYGIMVYLFTSASAVWEDVTIYNNYVEDISHDATQSYYSGMGIYCQTGKNFVVTGNIVRDVLKGRTESPPNRTLPPGGISINGIAEFTVTGNIVDGSGIDGIDIVSVAMSDKASTCTGNVVRGAKWHGIEAQAIENAVISGNSVEGTSDGLGSGVRLLGHATGATESVTVTSNRVGAGFATLVQVSKGTGTALYDVTVADNAGVDTSENAYTVDGVVGLSFTGNSATRKTSDQGSGFYAFQITSCSEITVTGNRSRGTSSARFTRGMNIGGCTDGLIMGNSMFGIREPSNSFVESSNTRVNFYLNPNSRQTQPMLGAHNIGNNLASDTSVRITYGTAAPVLADGFFAVGSVRWNLSPSAGGKAGWICTTAGSPGTWKTFGEIEA